MRKHPLIAFFVLAYVLTWWIYPLLRFSPLLGIPGLFGPALAAIIMATVTGGKSGVEQLLRRVVLWRVGVRWYVIALGLPTVLALAAAGLHYFLEGSPFVQTARFQSSTSSSSSWWLVRNWAGGARVAAAAREAVRGDGQLDLVEILAKASA